MLCMVLTGKGRLEPDIWPKTLQQAESTKSIMKTTLNKEAMRWQKASKRSDFSLFSTNKKTRHVRALLFCDCYQQNS